MTMPKGWRSPSQSPSPPQTPSSSSYTNSSHMMVPEHILWYNEVIEGFLRKRVVETQKITNYNVYQNRTSIPLIELDDIIGMNQYRASQSNSSGASVGRYTWTRFGTSQSKSRTIGDLVFIYRGMPKIIFKLIPDPQGVEMLAKAAKKRVIADKEMREIQQCPITTTAGGENY